MSVAASVTIVKQWPMLFSQLSSVRSKITNYGNGNVVMIALLVTLFSLTPMQNVSPTTPMDQHQHWHDCILALPFGLVIDLLDIRNLQTTDKPVPIIYCPDHAEFELKKTMTIMFTICWMKMAPFLSCFSPLKMMIIIFQSSSYGVFHYTNPMKIQSIISVMLWVHWPPPK